MFNDIKIFVYLISTYIENKYSYNSNENRNGRNNIYNKLTLL